MSPYACTVRREVGAADNCRTIGEPWSGVYVMVTLFEDPALSGVEWPTDAAMPLYAKLAETFADDPHVLFGLTNEPHDVAANNDAST